MPTSEGRTGAGGGDGKGGDGEREGGWMLAHAKIRESDVATVAAMKRRKKTTTDLGRSGKQGN